MHILPSLIRSHRSALIVAGFFLVAGCAVAELEIKEDIGDATETEWPKKSDVPIVANPTQARASLAADVKTRIGQSFTTKRDITLDKIYLRYSTKSDSGTVFLRVQEIPSSLSGGYDEGSDLFSKPLQFNFTVNTQGEPRFLELRFTGADQVLLKSGKSYVFEIVGAEGSRLFWHRRAADEYDAGEAYVNRVGLTGGDAGRDMALAIISK